MMSYNVVGAWMPHANFGGAPEHTSLVSCDPIYSIPVGTHRENETRETKSLRRMVINLDLDVDPSVTYIINPVNAVKFGDDFRSGPYPHQQHTVIGLCHQTKIKRPSLSRRSSPRVIVLALTAIRRTDPGA